MLQMSADSLWTSLSFSLDRLARRSDRSVVSTAPNSQSVLLIALDLYSLLRQTQVSRTLEWLYYCRHHLLGRYQNTTWAAE